MAYEVTDFQTEVIEASHQRPVLVDFWAPWCGPCRVLGPVLEKLVEENGAAWTLVKVNSDQHQELSARYGIRGIPAVKLFAEGKVVDEFVGALPEYAVRQWLEKALPSENKQRLERAQAALDAGDEATAAPLLEKILEEEPNNAKAQLLLARLLVFDDPARAESLVGGAAFAGPGFVQTEEAVRTIARLMRLHQSPEALPDAPGQEAYRAALDALAHHDFDAALEHFIDVIQQHRPYDDDGARKACVALFTLLGPAHPATHRHRRAFDMALY